MRHSSLSPPAASPDDIAIIRTQWRKAENRAHCPALYLSDRGRSPAIPRPARFSGGWAVAYDLPAMRSAYGLAGVAILPGDAAPPAAHRARLAEQWPLFRDLPRLPAPAFAGYGLEGAQPYAPGNPQGSGLQSLAYVRVGGSDCTYNIWSRLGRAHLERLLDGLRALPAG